MRSTRFGACACVIVCAAALPVGVLVAGPLDPPPGPVGPTMKTLAEVEPRTPISQADIPLTIIQSGSYYLTESVEATEPLSFMVRIQANDVTLDLSGFTIIGSGDLGSAVVGVEVLPGIENAEVRNGTIRGCSQDGVNAIGALRVRLVDLRLRGNGQWGAVAGPYSTLLRCAAHGNGSVGLVLMRDGLAAECVASENGSTGIFGDSGAEGGTLIIGCTAVGNGNYGILVQNGGQVVNSVARNNTVDGIRALNRSTVIGCTASGNGESGISLGVGSQAIDSTASGNRIGISVLGRCVVRGCSAYNNTGLGAPGAGIFVGGQGRSRIEGNHCAENDRGIEVISTRNLIIANTCSGNTTNYEIAADNRYGQIVDLTALGTGAVSGNSAASTAGSTDPWANFAQ